MYEMKGTKEMSQQLLTSYLQFALFFAISRIASGVTDIIKERAIRAYTRKMAIGHLCSLVIPALLQYVVLLGQFESTYWIPVQKGVLVAVYLTQLYLMPGKLGMLIVTAIALLFGKPDEERPPMPLRLELGFAADILSVGIAVWQTFLVIDVFRFF